MSLIAGLVPRVNTEVFLVGLVASPSVVRRSCRRSSSRRPPARWSRRSASITQGAPCSSCRAACTRVATGRSSRRSAESSTAGGPSPTWSMESRRSPACRRSASTPGVPARHAWRLGFAERKCSV